jgi:oligopeptide/dipeptide ABC transporter ATP-binding protein
MGCRLSEGILRAEGLWKAYVSRRSRHSWRRSDGSGGDHRPALVDVSLILRRGEVLGIVGESGSGKTTLARCLTLLERPDAGRVVFDGRDLTRLRARELRRERRRIQIIFQDPYSSLNPRLSVRSALAEVMRVHRLVPRDRVGARVAELLELVGLPYSIADRYPSDFSGGQRQRLCIARALAAEPEILVADEAVSSLDVSIQAQVLNLLLRLRAELGLTMVFISHDLHVVRRIAPTIAVMFGGRIVEIVPSGFELEGALHPYTRALLAAVPRLDASTLPQLDAGDLSTALPVRGCPFRERCPNAFDVCAEEDPPLTMVRGGRPVACHDVSRRLEQPGAS